MRVYVLTFLKMFYGRLHLLPVKTSYNKVNIYIKRQAVKPNALNEEAVYGTTSTTHRTRRPENQPRSTLSDQALPKCSRIIRSRIKNGFLNQRVLVNGQLCDKKKKC